MVVFRPPQAKEKLRGEIFLRNKRNWDILSLIKKERFFMLIRIEDHILYEDKDMIVCHKPAGTAVQSARIGSMDMESALKNYLAQKEPKKMPYLGIVHRLDQPVEGILVFAKNQKAAGELSRQMASGEMAKTYLAVTGKKPQNKEGRLEDWLKKDGKTNTSFVVKEKSQGAKKAVLSYELLDRAETEGGEQYLMKIHLETGRHHQIRVQMAHGGMPLLGDRKYNAEEKSQTALALCSAELVLKHPSTKKKMEFKTVPSGNGFAEFFRENK